MKIDEDSLTRLKDLTGKLMAYEARQILINMRKHRPCSKRFTETLHTPPEKIKKGIVDIFRANGSEEPDIALLREISLEYLETMKYATANPSFQKLKDRIERGRYDFGAALRI
ncbi:MAG: hypothetical protein AABX54_00315 [Nanoarchaeota archaeon]